jgi:multisubunit Na+/H+ antiporter MnhC subunit
MMPSIAAAARLVVLVLLALAGSTTSVGAEVLVRWDQDRAPSPETLGLTTIVVPGANTAAVLRAVADGYRVYVEIDAANVSGFRLADASVQGIILTGKVTEAEIGGLRTRLRLPADRILVVQGGAKWPHIRTNWVTKNNDVLQVAGRSAQPWIENNAALLRILQAERPDRTPLLTYQWQPITRSEVDEGPSLEHYLVAIGEAGSFGGDLLLPLHERFQRRLLAGEAAARAEWSEIKRYIDFYSADLPNRYRPVVNVGVITSHPMVWFETMNLLARHNVPLEVLTPAQLATRDLKAFRLLIVLDQPEGAALDALERFKRDGGKIHRVTAGVADPNGFAFEMRKLLGADDRVIDIWNGITVLTAPYLSADGDIVLVTVLNYAYQPLPVQLRVRGTFGAVEYESPEERRALVPHQHRHGYTEFVLPALRVGGRVFLSQRGPGR